MVFLLPMLLVFGLFSWWPIVRSFMMSVQQTNLVTPAEFVGLDNFRAVLDDPLLATAVQNTAVVRGAGAGLRLPGAAVRSPCS